LNLADTIATGSIDPAIERELPPEGPFPVISPEFGRALARLITSLRPQSVLEFGAGVSSVVVTLSLQLNGSGRLTTVEHAPQYSLASWNRVRSIANVDAELFASPLRLRFTAHGPLYAYQSFDRVRHRAPFDFVLVDSPPGTIGRDTTLYQALPYLAPGAILVLDDAARVQDGTVIHRWLRTVPGLEVL
jgi:predicted O-methyltransferase YrrM